MTRKYDSNEENVNILITTHSTRIVSIMYDAIETQILVGE